MTRIDTNHRVISVPVRQAASAGAPRLASQAAPADIADRVAAQAEAAAQRIRGLRRDDPDRRQKALRIVLETVLLQELGAALANDPEFTVMLDAVRSGMAADRDVAAATSAWVEQLDAGRLSR